MLLAGCSDERKTEYSGYVEGEYARIGSPIAGTLAKLAVKRGERVETGALLFELEAENERAQRDEAAERAQRAVALLADLRKGKRPEEIAAIEAQLAQARAAHELARQRLERQAALEPTVAGSRDKLDEARSTFARDRGRVAELEADLANAKLAARPDLIDAAIQDLAAQRAVLAQAEWRLNQKKVRAPNAALVTDTNFIVGEFVPASAPVAVLLAPGDVKIRFYVPETELGRIRVGAAVQVQCDGCKQPIAAKISFVSPQAEYTPPVIYSRENRSKLVFLIEARPDDAASNLHPGQPVTVSRVGS